jgi:putative transcriptional regulator
MLIEAGTLLVAAPPLGDPNFDRSVVFLCEHSDEGSFGLILNRSTQLTLGQIHPDCVGLEVPISEGGPVQPETLHVLHYGESGLADATEVVEGVLWGGDFDEVVARLRGGGESQFRFFLGYAGWSPEQLEAEVEAGGWIVHEGAARHVFPDDPEHLWVQVMREMGGEFALLSNFPTDPRLN